METGREEGTGGDGLQRRQGGGDYGTQMSSSHLTYQHHYIPQHEAASNILGAATSSSSTSSQGQGRPLGAQIEPDDDNCSPPPHLSATTTQTTTPTSTETAASLPVHDASLPPHGPGTPGPIAPSTSSTPEFPTSAGGVSGARAASEQGASWHSPSLRPSPPGPVHPQAASVELSQQSSSYTPDQSSDSAYTSQSQPSLPLAIKLLVSNNVAGSIIGRSGQTISDLQTQSATRIKLSQSSDFYPGTQDRVCLVQGHSENVKKATGLLLTRLYALQQQQHYNHIAWQRHHQDPMYPLHDPNQAAIVPGFSFVVRILVPTPCCGMIIGKGGTNIKQMVDNSGVSSVRLSPKEGGSAEMPGAYPVGTTPAAAAALVSATSERVVTITGPDLNSCLKCMHIILDGMTSHPDISRYTNMTTSYSRVMSAAQNALGAQAIPSPAVRSAPAAVHPAAPRDPMISQHDPVRGLEMTQPTFALERQLVPAAQSPIGPGQPAMSSGMAREGSYSSLINGGPFAEAPQRTTLPTQAIFNPASQGAYSPSSPTSGLVMGDNIPHSHSGSDLLSLQMQESLRLTDTPPEQTPPPPTYGVTPQFVLQAPQPSPQQAGFVAQIAIPDSVIGSILGRGGRTLNELQMLSNTKIRISQRGEFLPGTRNRVVTIRGHTAQTVTAAQFLISQRLVLPPTAAAPPNAYAAPVDARQEYSIMYEPPRGGQPPSQQQPPPPPQQQQQQQTQQQQQQQGDRSHPGDPQAPS